MERIKGFLVGTGVDPLGVAIRFEVTPELAIVHVDPMTQKSRARAIESTDPAVIQFFETMATRIRKESGRNRAILANFKPRRRAGLAGEWIVCPTCHGGHSDDCETCAGRGAIWKRYRKAVAA